MPETPSWTPYRESIRATLARTLAIAAIGGAVLAAASHGGPARWPVATLLMLWPSLGGHFVELWFLNWLRPRLGASRPLQVGARLLTWFFGGCFLAGGLLLTAQALGTRQPLVGKAWWIGGLALIGIELVVHLMLQLRGRQSFYNGRG